MPIKLHKTSVDMIEETIKMYKPGGKTIPEKLRGKTIIHMYPKKDTIDKDGALNGYYQNLFFRMIVFNINNGVNKMYTPSRLYDAVFTGGCNIQSLSIFKDGGFCTVIEGSVNFLDGQAPTFYVDKK